MNKKKRYFDYKDKTLVEGYRLIDKWPDTTCPLPEGRGRHCGFPEEFIKKALTKIKRLKEENKRLKKKNKEYKEILEIKNIFYNNLESENNNNMIKGYE